MPTQHIGVDVLTLKGVPRAAVHVRELTIRKRYQPPTPPLHLLAAMHDVNDHIDFWLAGR